MGSISGSKEENLDLDDVFFDLNKKKEFVSSSFIHKLQFRHFLLFNVAPPLIALGLLILLLATNQLVFSHVEVLTAITLWAFTGMGITVGYHRYFTHKSFKATRAAKRVFQIFGMMAGQGSVVSWSALHRQHHKYSDQEGDPHSPNLNGESVSGISKGLVHSHFTWMKKHRYPNVLHYVPDLISDKDITLLDRHYEKIFLLGLIIPGLISFTFNQSLGAFLSGVLFGGLIRVVFLGNVIWAINSFLHRFGTRPFKTRDKSHNYGPISLITFGEAWHNNHHAFPGSAAFGLKWYQFDLGFYCIRFLEFLNIVTDVKVPTKRQISIKEEKKNDN